MLAPWKKSYNQPRQHIKKQRYYFADKGLSTQNYGFSTSQVWMWEVDHKESWALKNWCFQIVVLEKTLGQQIDQTSQSLRKTTPNIHWKDWCWSWNSIFWPPDAEKWLTGKDSDAGRDWGQEEKVTTEDEIAGWHHWLDGHESEWTLGVGDGQGGLACLDSWGHKESDMTERLIWSDLIWMTSAYVY